jgi:hypothetical protein
MLEPTNLLDEANEDLRLYRLKRVGRQHMTFYELWREWLERE